MLLWDTRRNPTEATFQNESFYFLCIFFATKQQNRPMSLQLEQVLEGKTGGTVVLQSFFKLKCNIFPLHFKYFG